MRTDHVARHGNTFHRSFAHSAFDFSFGVNLMVLFIVIMKGSCCWIEIKTEVTSYVFMPEHAFGDWKYKNYDMIS